MPGRTADRQRDHESHAAELQRHRQLLHHQLEHRLLRAHRFAEVALQHAADPVRVTYRQGFVEVQLGAQVRDHARVLLLAGEDLGRVARQQLLQTEDQHRDEDQRRDDLRQALEEELEHGGILARPRGVQGRFPPVEADPVDCTDRRWLRGDPCPSLSRLAAGP
jgi:hypothetical protein